MPIFTAKTRDQNFEEKVFVPNDDDTKFATHKITAFQAVTVFIFLFLIAGFWRLQVQEVVTYREAADRNRIKSLPIPAPRGKILDRDGRVIVDNHSTFSAILSRSNYKEEHLPAIADGLHMELDELQDRLKRFRAQPNYQTIFIKEGLTPGEVEFVESHNDPDTFPELELIHSSKRMYPQNGVAAHVIGYVGEISEAEMNQPDFAQFNQGDVVGKAGIERYYNDVLMGQDGVRSVLVDNKGQVRQVLSNSQAVPGKTIQLTIDLDVQIVAELVLSGRRGSVVALDPRNGEILAMVSSPSYDSNKFAGRIRQKDWNEIINNPDSPLLNRAIQAQLAPGSTFKPLMAIAGLETGVIDDYTTYNCGGGATFYGHFRKCHSRHGPVALRYAIGQSCDVYFYNLGDRLGIDRIAEYAELAGLGKKTEVDLPAEMPGLMPSTKWKAKQARTKWYAGETISVAIGQGQVTVTPLQLTSAIGGLAMGGIWYKPHLLKDPSNVQPARRANWQSNHILSVIGGMYSVVNEGFGTATVARLPGVEFCGKTGTAQLVSNEFLKTHGKMINGRVVKDNAWFVGFAPRQNPEIAVVALFEAGEHGRDASIIARNVVKAYFDKKARLRRSPQVASLTLTPKPGKISPMATSFRILRDMDWAMMLLALLLSAIGVFQIYSATYGIAVWRDAWWKQIIYLVSGLLLMWLIMTVDYHTLLGQVPIFYGIALLSLLATFVVGKKILGGTRWISLPLGFRLQPSEFAKLVIVLLVARYLSELKGDTIELWDLARLAGLVGIPTVLVMKQPDLGTSLTYVTVLVVGLFLAKLRWQYVVGFLVLVSVALPVSWHFLRPYQKDRIYTMLDPNTDPHGRGYQVIQSKIAVGQGGMWGKGAKNATQTQLRFLPVPHTDFIFSTFAEEHGFVGVVVTMGLYFLLLMQVVQNAQTAPDKAGMYICMGVASILLFHILVNVGMVVGQMPVTGIPLPLLSFGGSIMWSMFLMLGLVNNVRLRRIVK